MSFFEIRLFTWIFLNSSFSTLPPAVFFFTSKNQRWRPNYFVFLSPHFFSTAATFWFRAKKKLSMNGGRGPPTMLSGNERLTFLTGLFAVVIINNNINGFCSRKFKIFPPPSESQTGFFPSQAFLTIKSLKNTRIVWRWLPKKLFFLFPDASFARHQPEPTWPARFFLFILFGEFMGNTVWRAPLGHFSPASPPPQIAGFFFGGALYFPKKAAEITFKTFARGPKIVPLLHTTATLLN